MATPLFVFPYAGAGAGAFRGWQSELGEEIDVRPVLLPGRDSLFSQPALTTHPEALAFLRRTLVPVLSPPFLFYGHSMGAHLAFEVVRDLRLLGRPEPLHLFVSGARAPVFGAPGPYEHLDDDAFVELLRRLGGTPEEVFADPELLTLVLPVLRADFALAASYRYVPGPRLDCPISAWGGGDDSHTFEQLAAWEEETSDIFRLQMLPGGHFFIHEHRTELLAALRTAVERAVSRAVAA